MKSASSPKKRTQQKSFTSKKMVLKSDKPITTLTSPKKNPIFLKKAKKVSKIAVKKLLLSPYFQKITKVSAIMFFGCFALYGVYTFIGTSFANEVVISKSEIISRVGKLTALPENEEPDDVVRVQDANALKKQNDFYKDAEEGDYVIIYKRMAVLYDLRNNTIVAVRKTSGE